MQPGRPLRSPGRRKAVLLTFPGVLLSLHVENNGCDHARDPPATCEDDDKKDRTATPVKNRQGRKDDTNDGTQQTHGKIV